MILSCCYFSNKKVVICLVSKVQIIACGNLEVHSADSYKANSSCLINIDAHNGFWYPLTFTVQSERSVIMQLSCPNASWPIVLNFDMIPVHPTCRVSSLHCLQCMSLLALTVNIWASRSCKGWLHGIDDHSIKSHMNHMIW